MLYKKNLINLLISYTGLFLGLFNTLIKPKVITSGEIGVLATIISIGTVLQLITQFGLSGVLMKYYPEYNKTPESRSRFIFSVLSITSVLLILVSFLLYFSESIICNYFHDPLLNKYFYYSMIFLTISHTQAIFERISRIIYISVKYNFITNFLTKSIHTTFLVYMLMSDIQFNVYFIFFATLNALSVSLTIFLVFKNIEFDLKLKYFIPEVAFIKKVSNYSFFMLISSLSGIMVVNIDKIMIGHYLDLNQTGIYTIAITVSGTLAIILNSSLMITQPKLSVAINDNNKNIMRELYSENIANNLYFGTIVLILISVFSSNILSFLGKEYSSGTFVVFFIALGYYANIFVGPCGEIISVSKYYKFDFYSRIFLAGVVIFSNYIFIPIMGITGAALATFLNFIIYDAMKSFYAYKVFKIHPFTFLNLKFMLSGLIVFLPIAIIKYFIDLDLLMIILISIFTIIAYELIVSIIFHYNYSISNKLKKRFV